MSACTITIWLFLSQTWNVLNVTLLKKSTWTIGPHVRYSDWFPKRALVFLKRKAAISIDNHNRKLTHWGRVKHICACRLTITGSDNGLSPGRRQAIIWTNAGILLLGPLGTNVSENSIEILTFSFTKMRLKVSSAKWRPFCLGLNALTLLVLRLEYFGLTMSVPCTCLSSSGRQIIIVPDTHFYTWHCRRVDSNNQWCGMMQNINTQLL